MAEGDYRARGNKHSPMVFCLDVTGSMGPQKEHQPYETTRIYMLNLMIKQFIQHVFKVEKAAHAVEVAFVLFTDEIIMDTGFVNICDINRQMFIDGKRSEYCDNVRLIDAKISSGKPGTPYYTEKIAKVPDIRISLKDRGTRLADAVVHCINKIEARKQFLIRQQEDFYPPFLVIATDGDPVDRNVNRRRNTLAEHQAACNLIEDHCYAGHDGKNLIVPIVIGVGDQAINEEIVQKYGDSFPGGFHRIRDASAQADFAMAAELICKSVVNSVNLASRVWQDKSKDSKYKNDVCEFFTPDD